MFDLEPFSALDRHHVDYWLTGGLAVSLRGGERATEELANFLRLAKLGKKRTGNHLA